MNRQNENIMPLLSSLVWRRHKNKTTENTLLTTTECKHKTTHSNYMTHKCAPTRNISQQHHSDSAANRVASAWCAARGTLSGSSLNFPNNTTKHTVFFYKFAITISCLISHVHDNTCTHFYCVMHMHIANYRKQLKTFMFQTNCGTSWLFWLLCLINTLSYLLTYYVDVRCSSIRLCITRQTSSVLCQNG